MTTQNLKYAEHLSIHFELVTVVYGMLQWQCFIMTLNMISSFDILYIFTQQMTPMLPLVAST